MDKLKTSLGKKVFVVSLLSGVVRTSRYGELEEINEPNNIVICLEPFGESIVPINNGVDRILKVYNDEGYVVYDSEDEFEAKPEMTNEEALGEFKRIWS